MLKKGWLVALTILSATSCRDSLVVQPDAVVSPKRVTARAVVRDSVPGEYIVTLKNGTVDPLAVASSAIRADIGRSVFEVYRGAIHGFAATLTPAELGALRNNPMVKYVEPNFIISATSSTVASNSWGRDRIDARTGFDGLFTYDGSGAGVRVYILDTGILVSHPGFGGRASMVWPSPSAVDCHGHGTAVAGIVGGSDFGVAPASTLLGVKVFSDCSKSGPASTIISGINWVYSNAVLPAVANMSFGGPYSSALTDAVNNLAARGVSVAVSAGNDTTDACTKSPSSATLAISTMAMTSADARSTYSNYGGCTDLFAPADNVITLGLNGATVSFGGTSAAAPHVAGLAAQYLSVYPAADQVDVKAYIKATATPNVVSGVPGTTPNLLLFSRFTFTSTINGPDQAIMQEVVQYRANPSFGSAPYSFTWRQSGQVICTTQTCAVTMPLPGWFTLSLETHDATGAVVFDSKDIVVTCPLGGLVC